MDQERIGKFIQEKRKKANLTQKELSKKLNISEKTISKWECGKGLPEVSLMQPLCQELKITVNELLNGQDDQEDNNQGYINYIKFNNQKNKKKIIIAIIIFIILMLFFILGIYFLNNYEKTTVYKLYGESENFTYLDGLLIKSNDKNILVQGKIISNNEEYIKTEDIIHTILKSYNQIIISGSSNGISIEDNGYNEIFTKEKLNNLNNWYIEVIYNIEGQEKTEIIKIQNNLIINSNKFFSNLTSPIGITTIGYVNKNQESTSKETEILEQKLIKEKFILTKNYLYERKIDDYTIRVDTKLKYVRAYKTDAAYGEDSIDIKYNCEGCNNGVISLEMISEGKSYYILYNSSTETLLCSNDNCPPDAWRICKEFYMYVEKLLKF